MPAAILTVTELTPIEFPPARLESTNGVEVVLFAQSATILPPASQTPVRTLLSITSSDGRVNIRPVRWRTIEVVGGVHQNSSAEFMVTVLNHDATHAHQIRPGDRLAVLSIANAPTQWTFVIDDAETAQKSPPKLTVGKRGGKRGQPEPSSTSDASAQPKKTSRQKRATTPSPHIDSSAPVANQNPNVGNILDAALVESGMVSANAINYNDPYGFGWNSIDCDIGPPAFK